MSERGRELQHFRNAAGIHQKEFNRRKEEIAALTQELEDSEMTDLTLEMEREPTKAELDAIAEESLELDTFWDDVDYDDDYVPDDNREVDLDDDDYDRDGCTD